MYFTVLKEYCVLTFVVPMNGLLTECPSCQFWMTKTLESEGKEYFISR